MKTICIRSAVRPAGKSNLNRLAGEITIQLSGRNLLFRSHKGSFTWIGPDSAISVGEDSGNVAQVKLVYRRDGESYFGIRTSSARSIPKLKDVKWPLEFSITPNPGTSFYGFCFDEGDYEKNMGRIETILKQLPKSDPDVEFDSELAKL